jgi:glycerol-3-phosphate acyltransferase PlsX
MSQVTIALDVMGGDFGPEPIIEGLTQALDEKKFKAILVGDKDEILSTFHNII